METAFLEYGVLGAALIGVALWGRGRSEKVDELQDLRVADAQRMSEALNQSSRAMEKSAESNEKLANAVASQAEEIRRAGER